MRIALISDCEGHLAALDAALRAMKRHAPDVTVVAGDLLTSPFSPDPPSETIALLRAEDLHVIPGNTDRYLLDWDTARWPHTLWMRLRRSDPVGDWIDHMAAGQARISAANLAWLRALPEELELADGVWVCHGMPGNPWNSIWPRSAVYDANVSDADRAASLRMLAQRHIELVLCGHIPSPVEYHDQLPDGRPVQVVRAGPRDTSSVSYAIVTRRGSTWEPEWHQAALAEFSC